MRTLLPKNSFSFEPKIDVSILDMSQNRSKNIINLKKYKEEKVNYNYYMKGLTMQCPYWN